MEAGSGRSAEAGAVQASRAGVWGVRLVTLVRWLLGLDYLINGLNWFHKIITPYPSMSDFVAFHPPPDIVGALIDNGILFPMAKATELITGLALLGDLFTPLALVMAMTVTVPVFVVDALNPHSHVRALLMGTGAIAMNLFLLCAYFGHYRELFEPRGEALLDPTRATARLGGRAADQLAAVLRPVMPAFGVISALLGVAMLSWLVLMIVQYAMNPLPISAVHHLTPR